MTEITLKITPFVNCNFLYQNVLKLTEECGEVAACFYRIDTKATPDDVTQHDVDWLVEECGDVIQAALNIIVRCGYEPQEVLDDVAAKNYQRGYYNAE